jgi:hypothetical protein
MLQVYAFADIRRYQGSLLVVFDSGLELAIPNELLVVPQKLIDDTGKVQINSTFAEVLIQPTLGDNAADTPLIGKQFFSSTYLFVDHDAGTFTIWQVNSTTDTRLVSVGSDCDAINTQETPQSPLAPTPNSSNEPLPEATGSPATAIGTVQERPSLTTGAIVGISVGAAAFLAAIAIIVYLCLTRKKRKSSPEIGLMSKESPRDDYKSYQYFGAEARHELHNAETSELAAANDARELDCGESKHGHRPRTTSHSVYEMATRSP